MISLQQRTLRRSVAIQGMGLHTGETCRVVLHPSEPCSGVSFVTGGREIRACIENVRDTHRGTTLSSDGAEIHTVEHLLAALYGMHVDNVQVEIDGPEVPAVDGSALPFVELIESAGIEEQDAECREIRIAEPVWVADGGKYVLAVPSEASRFSALICFANPMIGEQAASMFLDPDAFKREVAPARTFCTGEEIEMILAQGLGRGGTVDNVIVAYDDRYSVPLRFQNEFARHKLLDLIGDLSLLGGRLYADVTAVKPSHALNIALARRIVDGEQQGG